MMTRAFVFGVVFTFFLPAYGFSNEASAPCGGKWYKSSVQKLKKIYEEDQKDRGNFKKWTPEQAKEVLKRDRVRRLKVAGLFSRGCLVSAEDYYHAATVFQHGEVADHFLQAAIWANQAFQKGKESAGAMVGNGVDRYLMTLGYRQLFGGQAVTDQKDQENPSPCFCLWPIEPTFPEKRRKELKFKSQTEMQAWLKDLNAGKKGCTQTYCQVEAKPVPQGTVLGIW